MNHSNLTIAAFKNLKEVGSITPSSNFLVKKIIKDIDFGARIRILELGAGTGVITKKVLGEMSDQSELYSYENNMALATLLENIDDKRLVLKHESVSKLDELEDDYFDVVISSLPLANFKNTFKHKVYVDIKSKLKSSGIYIQYQYSLLDYSRIEKTFGNCKLGFCLFNLPPAFIYRMQNHIDN